MTSATCTSSELSRSTNCTAHLPGQCPTSQSIRHLPGQCLMSHHRYDGCDTKNPLLRGCGLGKQGMHSLHQLSGFQTGACNSYSRCQDCVLRTMLRRGGCGESRLRGIKPVSRLRGIQTLRGIKAASEEGRGKAKLGMLKQCNQGVDRATSIQMHCCDCACDPRVLVLPSTPTTHERSLLCSKVCLRSGSSELIPEADCYGIIADGCYSNSNS